MAETPKSAHDKVPKANVDHAGKRQTYMPPTAPEAGQEISNTV